MTEQSAGVYAISVAAEMTSMPIQNLRVYERRGLLDPDRTPGGTRRYRPEDIERIRRIAELLGRGLNLAGIDMVLTLEAEVERLQAGQPGGGSGTTPMAIDGPTAQAGATSHAIEGSP